MEFRMPTTQAEMDEIRRSLRRKLDGEALSHIVGGSGAKQDKEAEGKTWTCLFCGEEIKVENEEDPAKHLAYDCARNPFK